MSNAGWTARAVVALFASAALAACPPTDTDEPPPEEGEAGAAMPEGPVGAGQEASPISEDHPYERIPVIDAYYEGEKAWFIHTDVSDEAMAGRLTEMVAYGTLHVPRLGEIDPETVGAIYVFRNGVEPQDARPWGGGPFGYQIDVLSSVPGDEDYSSLRRPHMVTWSETATPRELRSVEEVQQAESDGELTVEPTDVIVNAPVVKWPTDYLGGEARMAGAGAGPAAGNEEEP